MRAERGALCQYNKLTRARTVLLEANVDRVFAHHHSTSRAVALCMLSGRAAVFEADSGEVLELKYKSRACTAAFAPEGRKLAVLHADNKVRIYDFGVRTGSDTGRSEARAVLSIHTGVIVPSVAIMPHGMLVYVQPMASLAAFVDGSDRACKICCYDFSQKRAAGTPKCQPSLISSIVAYKNTMLHYDQLTERWLSDGFQLPSAALPTRDGLVLVPDSHGVLTVRRDPLFSDGASGTA